MDFRNFKKLNIDVIDLVELFINGIRVWKSGYKNWVRYSTNADGTIYNNGLGYKNGYRIRSGGAETTQNNAGCTGFIPCKVGDTIGIAFGSGKAAIIDNTVSSAINFSNPEKTNLGQLVTNGQGYGTCAGMGNLYDLGNFDANNVFYYTVPSSIGDVAYIRVTAYLYNAEGGSAEDLIVTINEEIA